MNFRFFSLLTVLAVVLSFSQAPAAATRCDTAVARLSAKQIELSRLASKRGLHYVLGADEEEAISRKGRAGAQYFVDARGKKITSAKELDRLQALGIPPGFKDVWISDDPLAHLQAKAVDDAGRVQYYYHPKWDEVRSTVKFVRVREFAGDIGGIREQVSQDLEGPIADKTTVLAAAFRLLDKSGIRIGNEDSADAGTYGLTTLEKKHVTIRGKKVTLDFVGKSGVEQHLVVEDPDLAVALKDMSDGGSKRLFKYKDNEGIVHDLEPSDVNDYLKSLAGDDNSVKDFRTLLGSSTAARLFYDRIGSSDALEKIISEVMTQVSDVLGNTPKVAEENYVDPRIVELYKNGKLKLLFDKAIKEAKGKKNFKPEEIFLNNL